MTRAGWIRFLEGVLFRNKGLKLLALLLAIFLWWFVAGESKVQVGMIVPLEVRNMPPGLTITNKIDRQVELRLAGPPSLLGGLSRNDVVAVVNLAQAKTGRQTIHLADSAITVPAGVRVQRIYPNTVEVVLEKLERRSVPVVARFGGSPQARRRIAKIDIAPPALTVEALPDEQARIRTLYTQEIPLDGTSGTVANRVRVDLREGHAKIVGDPTVLVTVHFR